MPNPRGTKVSGHTATHRKGGMQGNAFVYAGQIFSVLLSGRHIPPRPMRASLIWTWYPAQRMRISPFSKQTKKKKPKKERPPVPKTVQDSIPFKTVFTQDGTIETRPGSYTRAYRLEDINFKATSDQEQKKIVASYMGLLNSFPVGANFQTVIINHAMDKRGMWEDIRFELQRDGLNSYRNEMNQVLSDKLTAKGQKSISQDKYIVISRDAPDPESAMRLLDSTEAELKKSLRKLTGDASIKAQKAEDRMRTMYGIYNQSGKRPFYNAKGKNGEPIYDFGPVFKAGLSVKDVIAPDGMEFNDDYFMLGDTYGRALFLEAVPNFLTTEFISDLSDIPCEMLISIHHMPLEIPATTRMIRTHSRNLRSELADKQKHAFRDGYDMSISSQELAANMEQTNEILDDINSVIGVHVVDELGCNDLGREFIQQPLTVVLIHLNKHIGRRLVIQLPIYQTGIIHV